MREPAPACPRARSTGRAWTACTGRGTAATRAAFETMVDYRNRAEKRHSGMWRDIAVRKRKTEVNQLLVPMVEEADAQGVPVPLNKRMIELVYDIEEGRRPQSWDNLSVLEAEMG